MKADYDSEADAIQIDLVEYDKVDYDERIDDGTYCTVAFLDGKVVGVELLNASCHGSDERDELARAAATYGLDLIALEAAVASALAAPDHEIRIELTPAS